MTEVIERRAEKGTDEIHKKVSVLLFFIFLSEKLNLNVDLALIRPKMFMKRDWFRRFRLPIPSKSSQYKTENPPILSNFLFLISNPIGSIDSPISPKMGFLYL